jgi:hypothetical protein
MLQEKSASSLSSINTGTSIVSHWTITEFPRLNSRVVNGAIGVDELISRMNVLLALLPPIEEVTDVEAKRLIVELGMWGSSVACHYQKLDQQLAKRDPSRAITFLVVGEHRTPFRQYFAGLVEKSETGHPHRDAYASLIRWNYRDTVARWANEDVARLPSVFADGRVRTYTDDVGEELIIELFKRCETLELAANESLLPIWKNGVGGMDRDEVRERFAMAGHMLAAVRRLLLDFPQGDDRGRLTAAHFMDVFRQFAIHWDPGDVPPSGPQDPQFILRDLMTGIGVADYAGHVKRIYPGLLAPEREELSAAMALPALPITLLQPAGITAGDLATLPDAALASALQRYPEIGGCYFLLRVNARVSAAHLMVAKKYLYNPAKKRGEDGIVDTSPVPNDKGITELTETALDRLNHARRAHLLKDLDRLGARQVSTFGRFDPAPELSMDAALSLLGLNP